MVVACGQRARETLVMIKSVLLFNIYQESLKFMIFTESALAETINEKLTDWRDIFPQLLDFEILPLKFPNQSETEWKALFKPCAAQRLFLPVSGIIIILTYIHFINIEIRKNIFNLSLCTNRLYFYFM